MTLPFPLATTRAQARANAIYYAGRSLDNRDFMRNSEVWSAIALTFPEDKHHKIQEGAGATTGLGPVPDGSAPIEVESRVYDVLRALAVRYVLSCIGMRAQVDRDDQDLWNWRLELTAMPDSSTVYVTVARTDS